MRQRWLVIGLFAASLALVALRVLPTRTTAAAARHESEVWRSHAERAARHRPAVNSVEQHSPAESEPGAGVRRVRRDVLAVVDGLPLTGVTLEVRESTALKTAFDVKLSATGRFADLVDLTGRLSRTPRLALGMVRLGPRADLARLDLEARSR